MRNIIRKNGKSREVSSIRLEDDTRLGLNVYVHFERRSYSNAADFLLSRALRIYLDGNPEAKTMFEQLKKEYAYEDTRKPAKRRRDTKGTGSFFQSEEANIVSQCTEESHEGNGIENPSE